MKWPATEWILFCFLFVAIILAAMFSVERAQQSAKESFEERATAARAVCIYAYYEKNEEYRENLEYFLENGWRPDIDFIVVNNGPSTARIPARDNITVMKRENKGYDFGAWQHALSSLDGRGKQYDYYVFINGSVRGPTPAGGEWYERFLELFNDGVATAPPVKLVGTTINVYNVKIPELSHFGQPLTHVQSMFFMMDAECMRFLKNKGFWKSEYDKLMDIVFYKEITMSQLVLKNGWNINCILPLYRGRDYTTLSENPNPSSDNPYRTCDDPPTKKAYFGKDITPTEVIFYKTNISCVKRTS